MKTLNRLMIASFLLTGGLSLGEGLQPGHWYSRVVNLEKNRIEVYDTFFRIENGQQVAFRSSLKTEPLPKNYKPGDVHKSLVANKGHWVTTTTENGIRKSFDAYYEIDSYGLRHLRERIVLTEPVEEVEKVEAEKPKDKRKLVHPSELGQPPIVGEGSEDTDIIAKKPSERLKPTSSGPEKLLRILPEAVLSVDWSKYSDKVSREDRAELIRLLEATKAESSRWQFDLSKRFLTCADGKCLVRDRGKGAIEVPFQVGLGRIWLLSIEAERLAYDLKEQNLRPEDEFGQTLQLLRRMKSMEAHLKYLARDSLSNYADKLGGHQKSLEKMTDDWSAFKHSEGKQWVLRWQLLAKDIQVFIERAAKLETKLPDSKARMVRQTSDELKKLLAEMGKRPWEASSEDQYEKAKEIYFEATAAFRKEYISLARWADTLRIEPESYIDMLVMLGAAENTAVYSWIIMEELVEESKDKKE